MIVEILSILFRFLTLAAVQVLLLNHIMLGGFINPFLYILFILTLPVRIPRALLLVVSMTAGLVIDSFANTMGMHAAACLVIGFIRPAWLRVLAPRDGYETDAIPSVRRFGFKWFLLYASILTLIHHFVLFYIEVFRFSEFFSTLLRVLMSSAVTLLLIIITQFLFSPEKRK